MCIDRIDPSCWRRRTGCCTNRGERETQSCETLSIYVCVCIYIYIYVCIFICIY